MFLTAINIFMARLEFYTVALLGLILLPFGMVRHLSFLAQKTISAVFNCAVKLAVIAFLQAMLGTVMLHMLDQYGELYWAHRSDMGALVAAQCQILLMALLMAFLTTKIPQLVQGLLSGSPSLSGGDMLAPAMAGQE